MSKKKNNEIKRCKFNISDENNLIFCNKLASWEVGFSDKIHDPISPFGEFSGENDFQVCLCDKHFIKIEDCENLVEFRRLYENIYWTDFSDLYVYDLEKIVREMNTNRWIEQYKKSRIFDLISYMGKLWSNNKDVRLLELSEEFHRKYLQKNRTGYFDARFDVKEGKKTDVDCPFCYDGKLVLMSKKKDICTVHVSHNGDTYKYICSNVSNKKCNGFFYYCIRWGWC